MQAERPLELPDLQLAADAEQRVQAWEADRLARQWQAARVVAISALLGLFGNLLFYRFPLGINLPLFVLVFVASALMLLWAFARPVVRHHIVFVVPAVICAALLSIYTAPQLTFFNGLLMLGSLVVALRFASVPAFLGGSWGELARSMLEATLIGWIEGPLDMLSGANGYLRRIELEQRQIAHITSVLRGLALTLPVVGLFALLLSSADVVFGQLLLNTIEWISPDSARSIIGQAIVTGIFAWIVMTGFQMLLPADKPESARDKVQALIARRTVSQAKSPGLRLGMIEAGMMLVSVDVLFAAFMLIQGRYLFGGQANISAQGYTYAEYARRGFYELLMVSFMTMLLALTLNNVTHRKREMEMPFRALTGLMIGLTMLLLCAAYYRLHLYQDAYGFTRIRVMSGVFMAWLGLLLVILLVAIMRRNPQWFMLGVIGTAFGFVLTLNVMNMDGFIASRNIDRFDATGKLDVAYLVTLSDDAVPAIAALLDRGDLPGDMRETLRVGLGHRLHALDAHRADRGVFGYHFGKDRAWQALDAHRDELRPYRQPGL